MKDTNEIRHGRHCVSNLHVHLIFVTKYRRNVFSKRSLRRLKTIFEAVCTDFEAELIEFDGEDLLILGFTVLLIAFAYLLSASTTLSKEEIRTLSLFLLELLLIARIVYVAIWLKRLSESGSLPAGLLGALKATIQEPATLIGVPVVYLTIGLSLCSLYSKPSPISVLALAIFAIVLLPSFLVERTLQKLT